MTDMYLHIEIVYVQYITWQIHEGVGYRVCLPKFFIALWSRGTAVELNGKEQER